MDYYRRPREVDGEPSGTNTTTTTTTPSNPTFMGKLKRLGLRRGPSNAFVQRDRRQTVGSICAYWIKHI